ncbi:hypothetical protein L2E82_31195 [Cichorium intybus]|uniref:Uncharacterized protein n=1 Tax=Cichorium intybus TaxID=13427 RepID=A0ACB9D2B0_CICIN|nr:hypothetical protein L2E82_31195 [Cichorium intybus]
MLPLQTSQDLQPTSQELQPPIYNRDRLLDSVPRSAIELCPISDGFCQIRISILVTLITVNQRDVQYQKLL